MPRSPREIALDTVKGALFFTLLGPGLGAVVVLLPWFAHGLADPALRAQNELFQRSVFVAYVALAFAYIIGSLPALATGIVAGLFRRRGTRWLKALLCGLLGAALALAAIHHFGDPSQLGRPASGWGAMLRQYGLMGVLPGFYCGFVMTYIFDRPLAQTNCPATQPDDQAHWKL